MVHVVVQDGPAVELEADGNGYFSGHAPARAGSRYGFRLDGGDQLRPDPASRYQPDGPHGLSEIIDASFDWTDASWKGVPSEGQVLYELHIGTFTAAGTFRAAAAELERLRELGITTIEMMPVAEFAGRFGWGYDGVDLFAPSHLYGRPDDLRHFVCEAHRLGLGVILDVVYNHFGPEGNYLAEFSDAYASRRHRSEWGPAFNFDGPGCAAVREFVETNAAYWIAEYHFDGLRLDATQQIFDESDAHIVGTLTRAARAAAPGRAVYVTAENEPQDVGLLVSHGIDAVWNDDLHHAARVALTGRREAYYSDYLGSPQEFVSAAKHGFLFQGQRYEWQDKSRGTPSIGFEPWRFIVFLENHDQVANSDRGGRLHDMTAPAKLRAFTAYLLLIPATPLLFQGQEFGSRAPFLYFADLSGPLRENVRAGRHDFLAQFPSIAAPEVRARLADPGDPATFERCRLERRGDGRERCVERFHRDLLALRRREHVLRTPQRFDGAVLSDACFVLRYFGAEADDRLLIVNYGRDLQLTPAPEPLLAPPRERQWEVLWSSEHPEYGGSGTPEPDERHRWSIPGNTALLLKPAKASRRRSGSSSGRRRAGSPNS